jgi:hypothetical protein
MQHLVRLDDAVVVLAVLGPKQNELSALIGFQRVVVGASFGFDFVPIGLHRATPVSSPVSLPVQLPRAPCGSPRVLRVRARIER